MYKYSPARFAQFARRVWDVNSADDLTAATEGIERMAQYFGSLDMPTRLRDFDIPKDFTARLADLCTFGRQRVVPNYVDMDYDIIKEILDMCY